MTYIIIFTIKRSVKKKKKKPSLRRLYLFVPSTRFVLDYLLDKRKVFSRIFS